ncbi:uncharacterized protein C1orf21 homolog isoform X1 [Hyperolius riggenbachi]|uniref:uncharacterized protein C1orf21 homolog isoform X1 n=1 Tax=Hyperolius riggenbachi TaxID=752182 RepID=UPI0035A2CD23
MGCASAKHVSTVQNEEDVQNGRNYQNGDAFSDEYRIKPVEEIKYMKSGEEEEQKIVTKNQENLEKSATHNVRPKNNNEAAGAGSQHRIKKLKLPSRPPGKCIHSSESQQEFFRMLDEKIEKGRDYSSEEEDVT